jgi:hypothetical protein
MPVRFGIHDGLVRLESDEPSSFAEWAAAVEGFLVHPDYRRGMGAIHDWRRHRQGLPREEIRARSAFLTANAHRFGAMRWALIAPADAAYGMGRMAEVLTGAPLLELRVFRDPEEAEAWVRAARAGEPS